MSYVLRLKTYDFTPIGLTGMNRRSLLNNVDVFGNGMTRVVEIHDVSGTLPPLLFPSLTPSLTHSLTRLLR